MNLYNNNQKQEIMLYTDLLDNPLDVDEKIEISKFSIDQLSNLTNSKDLCLTENTKSKISGLLKQGLKLGVELEKLSQRGVKIFFLNKDENNWIIKYFKDKPKILFLLGNENLLKNKKIKVIFNYSDLKESAKEPIVFISDRSFEELLRYNELMKQVSVGNVLLIGDMYNQKSNVRSTEGTINLKKLENKKVFISGSRTQSMIPESVQNSLELIKKQNIKVLIGDSEKGIDKEIIDFFRLEPRYTSVEVFTIKNKPRINVETEWKTRVIQVNSEANSQEKQMEKDRIMAKEADWGLAIFRPITKNRYGAIQVSSGTLRNTIQMLINHKAVKFFYVISSQVKYQNLKSIDDLREVLVQYKNEQLSEEEGREILTSKGIKKSDNPSFIKYEKVNKKFEELLRIETNLKRKDEENMEQLTLL